MTQRNPEPYGPAFWVNTVSLEHVELGVAGGFTQADHGRATRLKRLHPGHGLVFYSPRTQMHGGQSLQQFTALGRVTGTEPYQVRMSQDFHPWRLSVDFLEVSPTPARPLVEKLDFISDPQRWGYPFRRGLFEIDEADFRLIAAAMEAEWDSAG